MGIAPYKTFTFDGKSSADYGVYITGEGVFNAPKRAVEMIEIPNRNGAYALDTGRFENVEIKYKIGIVDDSETDFADRVSDFRNWLCSKVGYCRLQDEYNPDEYRMAVYASGIEIDHDFLIAGEAEITFNCKPQRWLKSGETATSVADGGTLTNPTRFDASPLLEVKGYGTIEFNGYTVELDNVPVGNVVVAERSAKTDITNGAFRPSVQWNLLNTGDTFTVDAKFIVNYERGTERLYDIEVTSSSHCTTQELADGLFIQMESITFTKGTSLIKTSTVNFTAYLVGSSTVSGTIVSRIEYDGLYNYLEFSSSATNIAGTTLKKCVRFDDIEGYSTKQIGEPKYIDCDIGECYYISGTSVVPLNNVVSLDSDLPILSIGTNTFNYDNTITELKVAPRWWRV